MKLKIALIAALVGAALAVTAVALGGSGAQKPPGLDRMTNAGTPVGVASIPAAERGLLDHVGVTQTLARLGARSGITFYRGQSESGANCLITGSANGRGARFGSSFCLDPGVAFPSEALPVLDLSTFALDVATGENRAVTIAGFAADGVARIGVVDAAGVAHTTPVANNVYVMSEVPGEAVRAIVAYTASGEQVFSAPLPGA